MNEQINNPQQRKIESLIASGCNAVWLEVVNESSGHNVPAGSETHFRATVVSDDFEGMRLVQRHQRIYGLLKEPLATGVHALALHCYTPAEWQEKGGSPESPNCLGGMKAERT